MEDNNSKEIYSIIMLNNGLVIKCKKEDIPSIMENNKED